ncbi:DUF445 family protein [Ramlibacter ginsenosidimutans]|uniref:DUF445 family protein n=2 Tax=Ramlibacter ginsenosidimutans TaxID=502333 RepID=A0A934TWU1_9BURK|nr:DUF445 family protein [Ramlibacter ginsenosidimutans]
MLVPPNAWVLAIRAVAEAALVGGLADWFAVSALFRRIPTGIPFITAHTDVIPRSKDRIADNLSVFVREKFLAPDTLVGLIRQHDPSRYVAEWLTDPAHAQRLGVHVARVLQGVLQVVEDARVEQLIRDAARQAFRGLDLTASLRGVLETLTREGRHDRLLEEALDRAVQLVDRPETRAWLAAQVIDWLTQEHPRKQKLLPRQWIATNVASAIAEAIVGRLESIRANPAHAYRQLFDEWVQQFVLRLQSDPALSERGEAIKQYLLEDETFASYADGLWRSIRNWLSDDLASEHSTLSQAVARGGSWLGKQLTEDPDLRQALRSHLEQAATRLAPEFAEFLTRHVRDTVRNWDARELAAQIELNIGKDLQAIRVNGTIVGGLIGLGLYLVTHVAGRG